MSYGDDYIESVLERHTYWPGPMVSFATNHVVARVKAWAGWNLNRVSFTGSVPKMTAIAGTTDVDIFVSMKCETPGTLRDLYESLYARATAEAWNPRRQNVSIRVTYLGVEIDLVPGRLQEGYTYYHSVWKRKQATWQQTAPELHVDKVKDSGRTKEIRATKVWRKNHNLDFPSFYLELTVMKALARRSFSELASNFLRVLEYISTQLTTDSIEDPSNTNNIVSDDLTLAEKRIVATQAKASREVPGWENTLW
jgi:hypothetical protein